MEISDKKKKDVLAKLGISMRTALAVQVRDADPPEAALVFRHLKKQGQNEEEIYHGMGTVAAKFLSPVLLENKTFDLEGYKRSLLSLISQ